MYKLKTVITSVVIGFCCMMTYAQTRVTGNVSDTNGDPVIGATILEKGTTNGIVTDINGNFTLNTPAGAVLQISYIGYLPQEINTGERTSVSIILQEDTRVLEEVVVIGYGTQRKEDITSSVATVRADDFNKGMVQDVGQLIQGKVAGLTISLPSGDPTAGTQMLLRGRSTISGTSTNPLVIIDGVPGSFNLISPEDIETIDVLKDGTLNYNVNYKGIVILEDSPLGMITNVSDFC